MRARASSARVNGTDTRTAAAAVAAIRVSGGRGATRVCNPPSHRYGRGDRGGNGGAEGGRGGAAKSRVRGQCGSTADRRRRGGACPRDARGVHHAHNGVHRMHRACGAHSTWHDGGECAWERASTQMPAHALQTPAHNASTLSTAERRAMS